MRNDNPRSLAMLLALAVVVLSCLAGPVMAAAVPPTIDLNGDAPGADYNTTFTEDEGVKPIVSVTGLTIDNGDDTLLTSAKATLTNRPDAAQESLAADAGATGLTVKYSPDDGELTIKGNDSVDDYELVLRSLTYQNTSQSPDIADRIVLITVSDGQWVSAPATSTVAINAVNDAPALDNSGNMTLPTINEDDQNAGGQPVTMIIKSAETGGEDRITDLDKDAAEGFAVIEAASTNGVWQYSLNSGIDWLPFDAVSNTAAVLLDGAARIRFVPNLNYSGAAGFSFRAWDQSGGRPSGSTAVDVSLNGGITPFSAATELVTVNVATVNDLPIVDLNGPEAGVDSVPQFFNGGPPAAIAAADATVTDGDHTTLASLIVTLTNRPDDAVESLAADATGTSVTVDPYVPTTGRLVLNGPADVGHFQQVLRSVVYTNSAPTPTAVARVVTVVANDGVEDGPTATATIAINPANTAPVLDGTTTPALASVPEDTAQPVGSMIAPILSAAGDPITDVDPGALEGIAVTSADNSHGVWQYSTANPPAGEASWLPVGVVADTAALLLSDAAWLRFVPAPDYFGSAGALGFRAWDRTTGSNGQRDVDVFVNGGNTAYSTASDSLSATITPVNDPPVVGGLPAAPLLYSEDAAPLLLLGGALTIADVDSPLLASATVSLNNPPDGDAEWLLAVTDGTPLTMTYADGALELTGAASPAIYEQVLRSVQYWNASQDPTPIDRVFTLSVADNQASSAPADIVVQVQPVNDPPEVDLDGVGPDLDYETIFYINRGPVLVVAGSLMVADIDDTTLKSASIRVVNLKNGQAETLSADLNGVTNIKRAYDPATGILTLTGVDSVANYQRVLRTITYDNILPQPNTEARVVEFLLSDGVTTSAARQTLVSFAQAPNVQNYLPMVTWAYRRSEEPNDVCAEALGVMLNVDESFRADDHDDWFFFDLLTPADLTVELRDFSPGAGQIIVAGGTSCGALQLLGNNGSNAPNKMVSLGQRPAGRYYIWIINDGVQNANAVYRLFIRANPIP